MKIEGAVVFITGANRGPSRVREAGSGERGAQVYAAARDPATVTLPGVVPVKLDVTDRRPSPPRPMPHATSRC